MELNTASMEYNIEAPPNMEIELLNLPPLNQNETSPQLLLLSIPASSSL